MFVITGGAGFIGSHLLEKMNDVGHSDIMIVDWLGDQGKWQNLLGKQFHSIVEPYEFLEKLKAEGDGFNIEAIFHLGACSDTTETNADYLLRNNVHYSIEVATYALKNKIPFLYASSAATYGDGLSGYDDSSIERLKPLNAYGWSKQLFDEWIVKQEKSSNWLGFKFFNVYGPNEGFKNSMASKVWHGFREVRENGEIKLFKSDRKEIADGEQKRDFIFVQDVVDSLWSGHEKLKSSKPLKPAILNLGTGTARSFTDLARAVFKATNLKNSIKWIEMPEKLKGKYQYFTEADMKRFNSAEYNLLGREFTDLESGVKQTFERLS